jgi:hypothetical protein
VDHRPNGQDPTTLYGSILRIDVSSHPYTIPVGNPFADGVDGAPEVWAYGLRNPWRMSFDGDRLYVADVGQNRREEVTVLGPGSAGANLGWAVLEGTYCFDSGNPLCTNNDFVAPVHEYENLAPPHDQRCAITGGYVSRSDIQRATRGVYVFGDYCTGELMAIRVVGGVVVDERIYPQAGLRLSSFGVDQSGRIYAIAYETGEVYRVVVE